MYTSDNRAGEGLRLIKNAFIHLCVSMFCVLFGAIYEHYSHGVYSYYMIYSFVIPMALGSFLYFLLFLKRVKIPSSLSIQTWNAGIATLTMGSIFTGVVEIYGSTNRLSVVYPIVGIAFMVFAVIVYVIELINTRHNECQSVY